MTFDFDFFVALSAIEAALSASDAADASLLRRGDFEFDFDLVAGDDLPATEAVVVLSLRGGDLTFDFDFFVALSAIEAALSASDAADASPLRRGDFEFDFDLVAGDDLLITRRDD